MNDDQEKDHPMRRSIWFLTPIAAAACVLASDTTAKAQATMAEISVKMTGVSGALAKPETGPPVQEKQKEVLRDLDELIASLEQDLEATRNGRKRTNPRTGALDSTISSGPGGVGSLVDPNQSEKDWAKLSSRERDRILQSMSEGFPPEYRQVLERYYRRLAEEKTAASGTDQAAPKDASPPSARP
jgi:hypothetical protein